MIDNISKMQELVNFLNYHTDCYDRGEPEISDNEWDTAYFKLVELEKELYPLPDSPTQKIRYTQVNELKKVKHNHLMLSLAKTKDINEIKKFFGKHDYITMLKMDGLTCSLMYENGKLIRAETRGDGETGEDITHNAFVIPSIPKHIPYKEKFVVDGEIVCTYKDFESFVSLYKNPRNFAAGSIRLLNSKECSERKLTFVAWDIIKGMSEGDFAFEERLETLQDYNFTVVPFIKSTDTSLLEQVDILKTKAKELNYPIDGLVFKYRDTILGETLGSTDHHMNNAIAFKFADDLYSTKLIDIEWSLGRTGVLTPVAIFEPIEIEGATISRANLHNISIMNELWEGPWREGLKLNVYRSNQIIPQVYEVTENSNGDILLRPEKCPVCKGATEIKESEAGVLQLYCINPDCSGKIQNKINHYCSKKGLDIKGISKAIIDKLIDYGWLNKVSDIYTLHEKKVTWGNKDGFGDKSVAKILDAIEESKKCTLTDFISAAGIPLVGKSIAKLITPHVESYEDFRNKIKNGYAFWKIDGIGSAIDMALKNYNYDDLDYIYNNYMISISNDKEVIDITKPSLNGKKFVITGKLNSWKNRDLLKADIEKRGGKVVGSVTKNTDYLINNDKLSTSAKNKSAQSLGIPIITEQEFIDLFDF